MALIGFAGLIRLEVDKTLFISQTVFNLKLNCKSQFATYYYFLDILYLDVYFAFSVLLLCKTKTGKHYNNFCTTFFAQFSGLFSDKMKFEKILFTQSLNATENKTCLQRFQEEPPKTW